MRVLPFDHLDYPNRLRHTHKRPEQIWVEGDLTERKVHVAIVGAREATPLGLKYAQELAHDVAKAGGVVVSGGAIGIDAAAHEGALEANGVTWAVLPTGHDHPFPENHGELFTRIAASRGATLSQYPPETKTLRAQFHPRNRVLVALSDVVVIVQAGLISGTRNTAKWARELKRPLWAVTTAPWIEERGFNGFEGCFLEIARGAQPLWSTERFLKRVGLAPLGPALSSPPPRTNENENKVLECMGAREVHVDEIVLTTGLSVGQVVTALLTMALEDVVVEASERWYRAKRPV
jgi:DNA processing protein